MLPLEFTILDSSAIDKLAVADSLAPILDADQFE
jgi:hypothetical protein